MTVMYAGTMTVLREYISGKFGKTFLDLDNQKGLEKSNVNKQILKP